MTCISPNIAAELSTDVYNIQNDRDLRIFISKKYFTSNNTKQRNTLVAKTGGRTEFLFRTEDIFGVIAHGAKGSKYENDMFLIFRGTNPNKSADIITDARIGLQMSKTGAPVHIGFNEAFKSMLPKIQTFILESGKHVNTFHCIGHSLGGAVATLAADWIKSATGKPVKAYTLWCAQGGTQSLCLQLYPQDEEVQHLSGVSTPSLRSLPQ